MIDFYPARSKVVAVPTDYLDAWHREWRRLGGAIIGGAAVVAAGWFSASQTFITSQNGQLIHPSPWNWFLLVCLAALLLGLYIFVATYVDGLPLFGRANAIDRDLQVVKNQYKYSLRFKGITFELAANPPVPSSPLTDLVIGFEIENVGSHRIEFSIQRYEMTLGPTVTNHPIDSSPRRMEPSRSFTILTGRFNVPLNTVYPVNVFIEYWIDYGPLESKLQFEHHYKAQVVLPGPMLGQKNSIECDDHSLVE